MRNILFQSFYFAKKRIDCGPERTSVGYQKMKIKTSHTSIYNITSIHLSLVARIKKKMNFQGGKGHAKVIKKDRFFYFLIYAH